MEAAADFSAVVAVAVTVVEAAAVVEVAVEVAVEANWPENLPLKTKRLPPVTRQTTSRFPPYYYGRANPCL